MPYASFIGYDRFVIMHNNAHAHFAQPVMQYFQDIEIGSLEGPPMSPDASPIKHLGNILKRNIRARNPVPYSIVELPITAQEE